MRKNILFVITKLELGGAQKQLLTLISHLDKEKFRPFLFTAQEGLLMPEACLIPGLAIKKSRWLGRPVNITRDMLALIEIFCFIKKNNIDIVHTHSSKAGILGRCAGRLAKAKLVFHTVHGWSFHDYQNKLERTIFTCLEKLCAKFTDKIIVVSDHDKQKGLNNRIGHASQYVTIRYGVDYAEFNSKSETIRQELGIGARDLVVGMVACFKPQKSPQDLIRLACLARERFPGLKFILVGDGILRGEIEKLINRFDLRDNLVLSGWRRDIPKILSAIDVFVLTSLWEGLPISVLEAMAAAKPSVVTRTGGVEEVIVDGKTGFLVCPKDMEGMCDKLASLLNDASFRVQMGKDAAKSLNYNFSLARMLEDSQNLYWSLIQEKGDVHVN